MFRTTLPARSTTTSDKPDEPWLGTSSMIGMADVGGVGSFGRRKNASLLCFQRSANDDRESAQPLPRPRTIPAIVANTATWARISRPGDDARACPGSDPAATGGAMSDGATGDAVR